MNRRTGLGLCAAVVVAVACDSRATFRRASAPEAVAGRADGSDLRVQWSGVPGATGYTVYVMDTAGQPLFTNTAPAAPGGTGTHQIVVPLGMGSPEPFIGVTVSIAARFGNGESERTFPVRITAFTSSHDRFPVETLRGAIDGERFGAAAASGDFDRDGFGDLAVGAPGSNRVYVYWGTPAGLLPLQMPSGTNGFGSAIAAGDIDGDGFDDLVVGSPASGEVRVYVGSPGHGLSFFEGLTGAPGSAFGSALAVGDDVPGGEGGHVIVGAPAMGQVFVYAFDTTNDTLGVAPFALVGATSYGASVAAAGDIDGDGRGDLVIGEPRYGPDDRGRIEIHFGYDGALSPHFVEGAANGELGTSVAAGDLNGDGYMDLIAGEPGFTRSPTNSFPRFGRVRAFLGSAGVASVYEVPLPGIDEVSRLPEGDRTGRRFGAAVAVLGDVSRDGYDDILTGAPGPGDGDNTLAYIHISSIDPSGVPYSLGDSSWVPVGAPNAAEFGAAVLGMDFDGSGAPDAVIGAPGDGAGSVWIFAAWPYATPRIVPGPPIRVAAGEAASMEGTVFSDGALPVARFRCTWSFGDGTTEDLSPCLPETVGRISHAWTAAGGYWIHLRVESESDGRFSEAVLRAVVD